MSKAVAPVLVTVKVKSVVLLSPSLCDTSSMARVGALTLALALTVWLSTVAEAVPEGVLVEVKVVVAWPEVSVPLVGETLPCVAEKPTGVAGMKPLAEVSEPSELCVKSAVTVEVPPGVIGFGEAETPRTSQGLKSVVAAPVPVTESQPAPPGPALQPHQLFSTSIVSEPL